ncbi:hypothetical protein LGL55_05695 [Clostridium tagluense]|uniref:hypothetical protein n=1 Tax=Clostridium tagluense TaxID=360422 RepID=UPI001CF34AE7|nr:hypothetical protein [Clostridium tagluense]MCB2310615.1 hypothetical protein [Clostridium tagluense]MCB2315654.1 hypothetical protein [Clostridium tagluense]MCB2320508.1 hypothetical protein [Clostridium tagluense]MCB2325209.1 hypothetical protein [Clostridium tagluense]MCB2330061.1 hypothetical protein [Clostridium tagluense]
MATKGFTKINNSIIFDLNLSCEAIGLYTKLQYLSTIDNFSIKRDYVKSISGYGETAFRRVWKELKSKGVLIESKTSNKGRFEYRYTLKNNERATKAAAPVEQKKSKHVDSNGDAPLDGQVHIDDVLDAEQQDVPVNEDIKIVAEITGLKDAEATELLKVANNDVTKVIEGHKYTTAQDNVKDIFNYTKWAIKNSKVLKCTKEYATKGTFNDYPQRIYDFEKLEKALLYGEQYELPV